MTVRVTGTVQGVGFRWSVRRECERLRLSGSAMNLPDGSVEVVAEGDREACVRLVSVLREGERMPGRADKVAAEWAEPRGEQGFRLG